MVPPQQVDQHGLVVFTQLVQRIDRRQVDQGDLVESDIDHAFLVSAAVAGQPLVMHERAGSCIEQGALADAITADQGHAWTSVAAQQRAAQRDQAYRGSGGVIRGSMDDVAGLLAKALKRRAAHRDGRRQSAAR